MIAAQTYLEIVDNSGAREVMAIGGFTKGTVKGSRGFSEIGDEVIAVIKKRGKKGDRASSTSSESGATTGQKNKNDPKIKKKQIHRVLIIATKKETCRADGTRLKFNLNAGILINSLGTPLATRIKCPLPLEIRKPQYHKLLFLSHSYV